MFDVSVVVPSFNLQFRDLIRDIAVQGFLKPCDRIGKRSIKKRLSQGIGGIRRAIKDYATGTLFLEPPSSKVSDDED